MNDQERMDRLSLLTAHLSLSMCEAMDNGGDWQEISRALDVLDRERINQARARHGDDSCAIREELDQSLGRAHKLIIGDVTTPYSGGVIH